MLVEGGTQKYTEIRRKEGDAVVLLKEIIQELFQKCKFFYQELENWRVNVADEAYKFSNSPILDNIKKLFRKHVVLVFSVFFVIKKWSQVVFVVFYKIKLPLFFEDNSDN